MASGFRVLTATGNDAREWSSLVAGLPLARRDIHFLPEYGRVYEATHETPARLACLQDEGGLVLQPFILRRLNTLPFLRERSGEPEYFDIVNPYGYGGPLHLSRSPEDAPALIQRFESRFIEHCRSQAYASEFCSLHPLIDVTKDLQVSGTLSPRAEKAVVYMDLAPDEREVWRRVRKGHKSSIQKARRGNVMVRKVEGTTSNLEAFKTLYYSTMARNQAAPRWFHPQSYFGNCLELLGDPRASLHFATVEGELAAAALLMHDQQIAYYHFAGSEPRFNATCAGNLLVFEAALWAKGAGYRYFHLGGGVTPSPDDSLFLFKSGFSDLAATLYTYSRVLHEPTYERLCQLKLEHEQRTAWNGNAGFFPLYRR